MATKSLTEPLVYGITLDQVDRLDYLVRTITANGDVFATGGADQVEEKTIHALGLAIFDAGDEMRGIFSELNQQRLKETHKSPPPPVSPAEVLAIHLVFDGGMHTLLVQAKAIVQVLNTAAYQAEAAEGIGGSCWAVTDMLQRVIDYVEMNFNTQSDKGAR